MVFVWCLHRACMVLVWRRVILSRSRDDAGRFLDVWILVLGETFHLNVALAANLIAQDEPGRGQLAQGGIHIEVVGREQRHLQALWTVFEAAFAVSLGPQPDEQQASGKVQLHQILVGEEGRLDIACASHYATLLPITSLVSSGKRSTYQCGCVSRGLLGLVRFLP
ncbi:hypothetical protein D3C78_1135010 [compost metagenome]